MIKRSITLAGHKTSLALEPEFWLAVEQIAKSKNQSLPALISGIDGARHQRNLSSAVRIFALQHFQNNPIIDKTKLNLTITELTGPPAGY